MTFDLALTPSERKMRHVSNAEAVSERKNWKHQRFDGIKVGVGCVKYTALGPQLYRLKWFKRFSSTSIIWDVGFPGIGVSQAGDRMPYDLSSST